MGLLSKYDYWNIDKAKSLSYSDEYRAEYDRLAKHATDCVECIKWYWPDEDSWCLIGLVIVAKLEELRKKR